MNQCSEVGNNDDGEEARKAEALFRQFNVSLSFLSLTKHFLSVMIFDAQQFLGVCFDGVTYSFII